MSWHSNPTTCLKLDNKCVLSMSASLNVINASACYHCARLAHPNRHRRDRTHHFAGSDFRKEVFVEEQKAQIYSSFAIFFDEEFGLFPPCQTLQSCHCQLELCGCCLVDERVLDANLSLSANQDAWWWQRCVCFKYVFDKCERHAAVATLLLCSLSAIRSQSFASSSVISCD